MLLSPEEARFALAVLERAEFRGAEEIRAVARTTIRLRWLAAGGKGEDPGGAEDMRRFCEQVLAEVLGGRLPVAGGWAAAVVGLERRLSPAGEPEPSTGATTGSRRVEDPEDLAPLAVEEDEASEAA